MLPCLLGCEHYIIFKTGQAVGCGTPGGKAAVVVNQPAQGVLHAAECRRYLHQLAELDGAAKKSWRGHNKRKHHGGLAEKIGEPDQVLLLFNEREVVGQHRGKSQVKLGPLHAFAFVECDRFAVFTDPHHVVAKVSLVALLLEVQHYLGTADVMGDHAAGDAIKHRHPDHEAGNDVTAAAKRKRKSAGKRPKDADETHQRHHRIQKAHAQ